MRKEEKEIQPDQKIKVPKDKVKEYLPEIERIFKEVAPRIKSELNIKNGKPSKG